MLCMTSVFLNLKFVMFCGSECGLSWWMFYVSLSTVCILLLFGDAIYTCRLDAVDWRWSSSALSSLIFCISVHYWYKDVEVSNCHNGFVCFSLNFFHSLPHLLWCSIFRHIQLRIVASSSRTDPIIIICNASLYPGHASGSEVCSIWN